MVTSRHNITLDPEVYEEFCRYAGKKGIKISTWVNEQMKQFIEEEKCWKSYGRSAHELSAFYFDKKGECKMSLTINNLEICFNEAKVSEAKFVGVVIEMEGFPRPEVIINQAENIDSKLEYYKKTYDENLNHKFAPGIKISGFSYGNNFADLQDDLARGYTLETYLKENIKKGAIDHAIRAMVNAAGEPEFYIHAAGFNSETLDFKVKGNNLIPKF